ncbi:MAG: hypothetical protein ABW223_09275 [Rariglobus sp.]
MNTPSIAVSTPPESSAVAVLPADEFAVAKESQSAVGRMPPEFAAMLGLCAQPAAGSRAAGITPATAAAAGNVSPVGLPGADTAAKPASLVSEQPAASAAGLTNTVWALRAEASPAATPVLTGGFGLGEPAPEPEATATGEGAAAVSAEQLARALSVALPVAITPEASALVATTGYSSATLGEEKSGKPLPLVGQGGAHATFVDGADFAIATVAAPAAVPMPLPGATAASVTQATHAVHAARETTLSPTVPVTEKLAAAVTPTIAPAIEAIADRSINKFLVTDQQIDAKESATAGTGTAKSRSAMTTNSQTPSPKAALADAASPLEFVGATHSAAFQVERSSAAELRTEAAPSLEITGSAADAAEVVHEVVELTHEFRARERNSVEVKFNLKDHTEVSVRLSYRDGEVHTQFRTESEALRATLSREWQGQAGALAQEARGYRVADPVFTSSGEFSQTAHERGAGSSSGGDARHQSFSQPDHPDARRAASHPGAFRSTADASSSAARTSTTSRVSTDRLLHAFA